MKKLLMLMVCCFVAMPSFAACNGPVTLGFRGQKPDANEFLYETQAQYDLTQEGYKNSEGYNSGSGFGYECDSPDGLFVTKIASCVHRDVVSMPAGHVFKGEVINRAVKYQCRAGNATFDDRWVVVDDGFCNTPVFGPIQRGECVTDNGAECRKLTKTNCSGYEKSDENGTVFYGRCLETEEKGYAFKCVAVECDKTLNLVAENGKCVPAPQQESEVISCGNGAKPGDSETTNACSTEVENADTCTKTCKDDGLWSGWTVVKCKDGYTLTNDNKCIKKSADDGSGDDRRREREEKCVKSGGVFENGKCECNLTKNLEKDPKNVGVCKCVEGEYVLDNDPSVGCVLTDMGRRQQQCETRNDVAEWIGSKCVCFDKDKVFIEGSLSCEYPENVARCKKSTGAYWDSGLKECLCNVSGYVWNKKDACVKGAGLIEQETQAEEERTRKRIADLTKDLFGKYNEMVSDVSVWKNKEGEFNTARLASDSIAGVVLGTAGGLITSKVVKKSQVKSGFEDVQCTIGGQKVSDWGDEFTVGIQ